MTKIVFVEDLYGSHVEQDTGTLLGNRIPTLKIVLHTNEAKD
jgi:hypothetical protein